MRQPLRPVAAVTALAGLTACGIQGTDVIGASGPATIDVLPARQVRMLLFFLSPDGTLMPVPRIVGGEDAPGFGEEYSLEDDDKQGSEGPERPSTVKTVAALVAGPQEAERRAGLHNDPSLTSLSAVSRVSLSGDSVDVFMAAPLSGLTGTARRQLVCTVAYAESPDGRVRVTLRGTNGALAPEQCDTWTIPAQTEAPSKKESPSVAAVDPS
ncbi:hypothetical protein OG206_31520 [Streptomyces sp. NBC_01341]|uniref:hypothetical protein n=1 Tax=Streptomyces sp. NBC_01341 TaxID=2903831 RepID=UPI002E11092B|nr:hypothetical protein OG206_31520 [Streptomyces sp. NBC_01341]